MSLEISLEAYVLPADHTVFKLFPGKTYRFREVVHATKAAFLDIRGLEELPSDPADWDDKAALAIIAHDRYLRALEKQAKTGRKDQIAAGVTPTDRRTLTFLRGLLLTAKQGDLIVIPAEGYRREVLIGEVLDDPGSPLQIKAKDGGVEYVYLGRRVKWLPGREKRLFSEGLIGALHSQSAFHFIERGLRDEIYRVAYGNYVFEGAYVATFETKKEVFTTADHATVAIWFNAMSAVREAVEENASLGNREYVDIGLDKIDQPDQGELAININSPGTVLLKSLGPFAFIVMAMFPLAVANAKPSTANPPIVKIHKIGKAKTDCALEIQKGLEEYAKALGAKRWKQHCEMAKRVAKEATLSTPARLK